MKKRIEKFDKIWRKSDVFFFFFFFFGINPSMGHLPNSKELQGMDEIEEG